MTPTRREFIQSLGIALASWVLTGCGPTPEPVCYIVVTDEVEAPSATPTVGKKAQSLQRVRDCWLRLDWLAGRAQAGAEEVRLAQQELTTEHRAALDELVASGAMSEDVAHCVRLAFATAVQHVVSSNPPSSDEIIECYVMVEPVDATPTPTSADQAASRIVRAYASEGGQRLAQQAELLAEIATTSDIDPDTVKRAQEAIGRDVRLLSPTGREELIARLVEASGGTYEFPPIEEVELDIPPEVAEAARFLVELLLED